MSIVLSIESLNTPLNSPICGINTELFEIGLDIFYFWPERQSLMNKSHLVESLKSDLRQRYDRAVAALAGAHEAATGADTKAENKYDTRGLEASYLAAGQADQAEELLRGITSIEAFKFKDFDMDETIGTGALVEAEREDELLYYLLAPAGGGMVITADSGESVTVLGPASPLAGKLNGKTTGTILHDPDLIILEVM